MSPERDGRPSEHDVPLPRSCWPKALGATLALLVALVISEGSKPRLVTGLMVEDPLAGVPVAPITSATRYTDVQFLSEDLQEPRLSADLREQMGQDIEAWRMFRYSSGFAGTEGDVSRLTRVGERWILVGRAWFGDQRSDYAVEISSVEARQFRERFKASVDRVKGCPKFHGDPQVMCGTSKITFESVTNGGLTTTEIYAGDCMCFRRAVADQREADEPLETRIKDGRCRLTRTRWHFDPSLAKSAILSRLGLWP